MDIAAVVDYSKRIVSLKIAWKKAYLLYTQSVFNEWVTLFVTFWQTMPHSVML